MIQTKINYLFKNLAKQVQSNNELAKILSVDFTQSSRMRSGQRSVNLDQLQRLAQHLNVQIQITLNPFEISTQ